MQASILPIKPFDAIKGTVINFEYQGNSVIAIRCIIKKNTAEATVKYDGTYTISSDASGSNANIFSMTYTVPGNSESNLVNGSYYNAFICVAENKNQSGDYNWSEMQSIGEPFRCISTPSFDFNSIPDIIETSSYSFSLRYDYNITSSETLRSWIINIYDTSKNIIASSGTVYENITQNADKTPIENTYFVDGFNDGVTYYIKAFGETENGMQLETQEYSFKRNMPKTDRFYMLRANNIACQGGIHLESFVIIADGILEHDGRYIYDDSNNPIMLSTRGNSVIYRDGFQIDGDGTISIIAADIDQNETFLSMSNSSYDEETGTYSTPTIKLEVKYIRGNFGHVDETGMFQLTVTNDDVTTVYFSNELSALIPEDLIQVTITRKRVKNNNGNLTDSYMWDIGARLITSDDRIHAKQSELDAISQDILNKYNSREIELGYPLDFH